MFHIFHIFHIFQHPMNKWMRNDFGNIQGIGDKDLEWWMLRMTSKCAVAGHEHVIEFGNNSKPSQYYQFYGYQIKAKWDRLVAWLFHIILIPSGNFLQFAIEYRNDGCFMDDSTGSYQLVVAVAKVWDVNQQKSREAWTSRMYPICSMVVYLPSGYLT